MHVSCTGRRAKEAARYPRGLCRAIIKGITAQLRLDNLTKEGCYGIQVPDGDAQVIKTLYGPEQGYSGKYRDDLSGQVLKDTLVEEARANELLYFHSKGVWLKVPWSTACSRTGRPPISPCDGWKRIKVTTTGPVWKHDTTNNTQAARTLHQPLC